MKLRLVLLLMLLAGAFAADAASRADIRKSIERSVLVTGTIDIGTDGTVIGHRVDQPEKLPEFVRDLVARAVPGFRFEPVRVDGRVVKARAKMGIRVIAKQLDDGNYRLRIGSASFGEEGGVQGETVTAVGQKTPPRYPEAAYMSGVQGTVYLVLKIDRQGTVVEAIDEQVNLTILGNESQMKNGRMLLARAAIAAAKKWRYDAPTRGPLADEEFWSVRVPIDFKLCDGPLRECQMAAKPYGRWEAYIPGPKNHIPWITDEQNRQNPDAMIAGDARPVGSGPRLLTPVNEG